MITVFTTGGTFDKVYFDASSEFSVGEPQAGDLLVEAGVTLDYEIISVFKKDSLDLTDEDRNALADRVSACPNTEIVIVHGTDTMVESAVSLRKKNLDQKKIVFVGAMQPARMRCTDAMFNLGVAIAAVQLVQPGIYIAMNGLVFPYDNVRKNRQAACFERID